MCWDAKYFQLSFLMISITLVFLYVCACAQSLAVFRHHLTRTIIWDPKWPEGHDLETDTSQMKPN